MKDSVENENLSLCCDGLFMDGYEAAPIKFARL